MRQKQQIPACDECQSRFCSIFNELEKDELDILSENKCGTLYKKGQNIFYEGNRPTGLFCMNSGKVKIYKIDERGNEQIVRLAKGGDVLGYRSLISNETYSAYATALDDTLACFIPKDVFFSLVESNIDLSLKVMKLLAHDLKSAENLVASMSQKTVRERVAETLLILKEFYGLKEDGVTLDFPVKRDDLAHLAGTATETVIRFLSEFKQDKLIDVKGRTVKILDHEGLVDTANLYD